MAETDKLNIDNIIGRLLEGKTGENIIRIISLLVYSAHFFRLAHKSFRLPPIQN